MRPSFFLARAKALGRAGELHRPRADPGSHPTNGGAREGMDLESKIRLSSSCFFVRSRGFGWLVDALGAFKLQKAD